MGSSVVLVIEHLLFGPMVHAVVLRSMGPAFRSMCGHCLSKVAQLLDVMRQKDIRTAPVTRPDGTLIGLVRREDLEEVTSKPSGG